MRSIVISTHDECHAEVFHFVEVANKVQKELVFSRRLLTEEQRGRFFGKRIYGPQACSEASQLKNEFKLGPDDLFLLVVEGNVYDDEDDEWFFVTDADYSVADKRSSGVAIISLFFLNPQSAFMKEAGAWWTSLGKADQRRKKSDCELLLMLGAVAQGIADLGTHNEMRGCIMDYCQDPAEIIKAATGKFQFCAQECLPALSGHPEGQAVLTIAQSLSDTPLPILNLEPEPGTPGLPAGTVVISVHGIRTRGAWQKTLTSELNDAGFKHEPLDYGFFRAVRLLFPSARATQVDWFRDEYTRVRQPAGRNVSVIAHSFGTYVVAGALEKYAEVKLESIILCGSIVRRDFAWSRLIPDQVRRVLNDYGRLDIWVRLSEWCIADAGPSGASGFSDDASGRVQQRPRPKFRHSDYFYRLNYQKTWIPFLKGETLVQGSEGGTHFRNWKFLVTKIAVGLALLGFGLILWRLVK